MAHLFNKSRLSQSLQLGFSGAWAYDYPYLSLPLAYIQLHCPKLTKSFSTLPSTVQSGGTTTTTTAPFQFISDNDHKNIHPFDQNSRTIIEPLEIQIQTKGFVQNKAERYFRQRLLSAHIREYGTEWYDKFCDITLFTNVRFTNRYVFIHADFIYYFIC
jgi:hypothetical protein